ncbi:MAG TPA: PspC domain-containing protein [Bryobacteraceae bacterium]|jgi:phage shock protein C|nr:PspC domain-containing protein [Bryobacteraceae bacterium]
MYCTQCGLKLDDRARFCSECGTATGAGMQQAPGTVYNRLSRPREERKLAGVCAGIARYFGVDVTLVRILTVVLAIWPVGVGLIFYIVCWIVMPNDPLMLPAPPAQQTLT